MTEYRAGPYIRYIEDIRTKKLHGNAERITTERFNNVPPTESAVHVAFEYSPRGYALVRVGGKTYKIRTCKSRLGDSLRELLSLRDEEMELYRVNGKVDEKCVDLRAASF